jgi:hydrogenase maturation protease
MSGDLEMKPKVLVIGIGNEFRSDDAFGLFVARRLKTVLSLSVRVIEHHGEGASLMEAWDGFREVILVDAVRSGGSLGTLFRLDASSEKIPTQFFNYSSHDFGVAEAIETARLLGRLPARMILFGVEGGNFGMGESMSPEVAEQIDTVAKWVMDELSPAATN